jgi:hypothetical protein
VDFPKTPLKNKHLEKIKKEQLMTSFSSISGSSSCHILNRANSLYLIPFQDGEQKVASKRMGERDLAEKLSRKGKKM